MLIAMPMNNKNGRLAVPYAAKRSSNDGASADPTAKGTRMLMVLTNSAVVRWR
jgi:hypothetical protein